MNFYEVSTHKSWGLAREFKKKLSYVCRYPFLHPVLISQSSESVVVGCLSFTSFLTVRRRQTTLHFSALFHNGGLSR
jgi:hypothetical protein